MDINRIRELLPHRYPFQLVDKVIEIGANYIVGVKNVTANEPFFQDTSRKNRHAGRIAGRGHGADRRFTCSELRRRTRTLFHLLYEDRRVKFRQKVVPGDTLIFRVELLAPIRRGISTMKGYVFVGEKVVCEAEFMAQNK